MTRPHRALDGASIVLHGAFDPRGFHPAWFAEQGLLAHDEAKAAIPGDADRDGDGGAVLVVSGALTTWRAGWLAVQVTHERLAVSCADIARTSRRSGSNSSGPCRPQAQTGTSLRRARRTARTHGSRRAGA